jgi:dTDP-4-dehydrorhamnose reductase
MKLLLLGADGQVGHALERALSPLGDLIACNRTGNGGRRSVDLAVVGQVAAAIEHERPDWIVNAAAYTAVDQAESEADLAFRANALALTEIAAAAQGIGAAVLHYSTDYVFPGDFRRPCREDDPTGPLGVYGESKLAGEIALREGLTRHLILRTSWVYAARGKNFLHTMLRLAADRPQLRVVCDQLGAPTPAHQIAAVTALLIDRQSEAGAARWGCYHLASAGQTSWHGFASAIIDGAVERGWLEKVPDVLPISTAEFPTPARRPADSRLDCSKLHAQFGLRLPDWRVGLEQVLGDMESPSLGPRASRPQAPTGPQGASSPHGPSPTLEVLQRQGRQSLAAARGWLLDGGLS